MHTIIKIMLGGGLFAFLSFIHFFVDWIFQSHSEAMVKHNNPKVRAKHCFIYTLGFVPLMIAFNVLTNGVVFGWWDCVIAINLLFWSHFAEDTYLPVFLWAKYIRRPPEMLPPNNAKEGFVQFIQTTLGKILMISIDQIIHLAFLLPIVYLVMRHIDLSTFENVSCTITR